MKKFKENQVVRVKYFTVRNAPEHWTPTMVTYRNAIVTIKKINNDRYYVSEFGYIWYKSDFEKVNTNV